MPWQRNVVYFKGETWAHCISARAILGAGRVALGLVACLVHPDAQSAPPQTSPPPVVWANPMQGGPIAVLLIGPEAAAADFDRLEQGLQLKASRVTFTLATENGSAQAPKPLLDESALDDLARALENPPDVVVLARIGADDFPAQLQRGLRAILEEGTGLVLVSYGPTRPAASGELFDGLERKQESAELTHGIGAAALTGWQEGLDSVRLYEGERGRAVAIAYWSNAPQSHCLVPAPENEVMHAPGKMDNYLSLVARAVRWAAGRDPEVGIEKVESMEPVGPAEIDTPPQIPPEFIQNMKDAAVQPLLRPYRLRLNRPAKKKYAVRVRARYPYRGLETTYTPHQTIGRGDRSIVLDIPVGYGECFLDFSLLDGDAVVDWYTESTRHEGWPELSKVAFSKLAVEANDTIEISFSLRPRYHRPRPCMVFVRATDSLGRRVAEKSVPVGKEGGDITVELPLVDLLAPYLKVEIFVADTTEALLSPWSMEHSDYSFTHVLVRRTAPNGFRFIADGSAVAEFNVRHHNGAMASYGIDAIHVSGLANPVAIPALDHLDVIPTVASYVTPAGLDDPETMSNQEYKLGERIRRYRYFGPGLYVLKMESAPDENGASATNTQVYAQELNRFLAAAYPDVNALNQAWGTEIEAWNEAAEAVTRGLDSTAARMDIDAFEEKALLKAYLRARNVISELDARGRVGIEWTAPERNGYLLNSASFMRSANFLLVSESPLAADKVIYFRPEGGTAILKPSLDLLTRGANFAEWLPWYAALHALDGLWIDDRASSMIERAPRASTKKNAPEGPLASLASEVRVVQSGIAEIIKRARPVRSGIAVYESRSSARMDQVLPVESYGSRTSQEAFARLLAAFGYQFDFIDYESVVEGALANYSLCILPFARALSYEEIVALQRFHQQGGALLADLLPGRYDEHATPRKDAPLLQLFGVSTRGQLQLGPLTPIILEKDPRRGRRRKPGPPVRPDRSIHAAAAEHLATSGETEIGFRLAQATGRTMLLNYCLGTSPNEIEPDLERWIEKTGATKIFSSARLNRSDFSGHVSVFEFSEATLYAFLRRPGENDTEERVRLSVASGRHAYDVLSGKHYGPGAKVTLNVTPGRAALLSSLPYEVTRVIVTVPEIVGRGRRLSISAAIKTRGGLPKDHIVHVAVTAPDGSTLRHYAHVLDCPDGRCETYVPLALNDVPGEYTIAVRDVLTGTVGQTEVTVR